MIPKRGTYIRTDIYRSWRITWPSQSERYIFFGPEQEAIVWAETRRKKLKWPYKAKIEELKL